MTRWRLRKKKWLLKKIAAKNKPKPTANSK